MLKQIEGLPKTITGLRAEGKLTRDDYETVLNPILAAAHREGRRVRFLYQLGPEFSGFTAGAALEDFRVGLKYLRIFERCAVVTDVEWIHNATRLMGSFIPCPVQVFKNSELKNATEWLSSPEGESNLKFDLKDDGVLVVHPQGPLIREDFDRLSSVIDPWVENHKKLNGLIICIKKFPGWENVGSFIHHLEFIKSHHRKIRRIALAVDGTLPGMVSKFASHFVEAEIKQFPFESVEEAKKWVNA